MVVKAFPMSSTRVAAKVDRSTMVFCTSSARSASAVMPVARNSRKRTNPCRLKTVSSASKRSTTAPRTVPSACMASTPWKNQVSSASRPPSSDTQVLNSSTISRMLSRRICAASAPPSVHRLASAVPTSPAISHRDPRRSIACWRKSLIASCPATELTHSLN